MAYRVSNTAPVARGRPVAGRHSPSSNLTRNALIAGVSFAALALGSAGALLTGNNDFAAVSHAERRALKIALVDAV
ncbi:MAG: hypothetical protein JO254_13970, partial [Pseudolabrys sp.]|nr:hypothetical protein [Pseudolabrys sp.]